MRRLGIAAAALLAACGVHRDMGGPPGNVELLRPPVPPERAGTEPAHGDGEHMLVLSPGAFGTAGARAGKGVSPEATFGVEASVHYGWSARSHTDGLGSRSTHEQLVTAEQSVGVNVGWTMLVGNARHPANSFGAWYAELQFASGPAGFAAGPLWTPVEERYGLQATAFLGPLFLRCAHVGETHTSLQLGLFIKGPNAWIWQR